MKTLSRVSFAMSFIAAVALLGAGCASSDAPASTTGTAPSPAPTTTTMPTPSTPSIPSTPGTPSSSGEASSTITTSSTLDTTGWQDYQNKTLKFSFKYPLRGAFAPEFAVKLLPLTSPDITNDCIPASSLPNAIERRVSVNGTAFCRTGTVEGTNVSEDRWVTKTDTWYAVITFTKRHPTNRPFDFAGYNNQLEAIMSTFQFPASQS